MRSVGCGSLLATGSAGRPQAPDDAAFNNAAVWKINIPKETLDGVNKSHININYTGDAGRAYIGDEFVNDNFYNGKTWEIGINRFAPEILEQGIIVKILPLRQDAPIYIPKEYLPDFNGYTEIAKINSEEII